MKSITDATLVMVVGRGSPCGARECESVRNRMSTAG